MLLPREEVKQQGGPNQRVLERYPVHASEVEDPFECPRGLDACREGPTLDLWNCSEKMDTES